MDIEKYLQSGKLEQYVLGLASSEERKEVEKLAKEFPEIDACVCELHNSLNFCSEANKIPVYDQPKHKSKCKTFHLKSRTNLVVEPKGYTAFQKSKFISLSTGIAAFFVIGLSVLALFSIQGRQAARYEASLLSTQLHHLKLDIEAMKNENDKMVQQYVVLKDVSTRHVNLKGSKYAPQAHGVIYWNADRGKALLNICNLPEIPQGHQYCVWADINGKHQKIGVFNAHKQDVLHNLSFIKECNSFCVTLEKEGVNVHPNIDKMLVEGEM